MKFAEATKFHRKSGGLGFPATMHWKEPRVRLSVNLTTGFADPRGDETAFDTRQAAQQVPPLRCAPVGMTNYLRKMILGTSSHLQQNCHPDRSVAQWRDLLLISPVASASPAS
jgi:hypothetical protein